MVQLAKTTLLGAILVLLTCSSLPARSEAHSNFNSLQANLTSAAANSNIGKGTNKTSGELETAPSITSVHHQVWTSSSSGSLDELSPELIGKLRQDVPFLAAYALRPRLVGSSLALAPAAVSALTTDPALSSSGGLDGLASSPRAVRRVAASSPAKSLGDFSEFKVETSSLSKSEHRHQRKTSLKRQPKDLKTARAAVSEVELGRLKRNKMVKKTSRNRRKFSGQRSRRGLQSKLRRPNKGRSRPNPRERLIQTADGSNAPEINGLDADNLPRVGDSGVKGGDTKGGASPKKQPFYSGAQPRLKPDKFDGSGEGRVPANSTNDAEDQDQVNQLDEDRREEPELDDEPHGQPKRVGDPDVDEEGDTVLVEPKSDGVDDDPELPSEEEGEAAEGEAREKEVESSRERTPEADERGRRVNRAKPNEILPRPDASRAGSGDHDDDDDDRQNDDDNGEFSGNGQAAGGGLGATIGGGQGGGPGPGEGPPRESPGVEFADDDRGASSAGADGAMGGLDGRAGSAGSVGSSDGGRGGRGEDSDDFGQRRKGGNPPATGFTGSTGSTSPSLSDEDEDLDYRDEIDSRSNGGTTTVGSKDAGARKPSGSDARGNNTPPNVDSDSEQNEGETGQGAHQAPKMNTHAKTPGDKNDKDCETNEEDGSYKAHDEKYHNDHHQTIDWLRGSIPGEPDDDYPILDRVENRTSFKCSNQKHPGYYADVEARCQVSTRGNIAAAELILGSISSLTRNFHRSFSNQI